MAKPEWGQKRTCNSCGCRFYDMSRSPITCPKCGSTVEPDMPFKVRRSSSSSSSAAAAAAAAQAEAKAAQQALAGAVDLESDDTIAIEEDEDAIDNDEDSADEDESGLIEDASDLGEDDDDMAEVMEHLDEGIEDEV